MLISRLFTKVAVHDSQFEIILIYLIVGLGAAPQFTHCLKQVAYLSSLSSDWPPLTFAHFKLHLPELASDDHIRDDPSSLYSH